MYNGNVCECLLTNLMQFQDEFSRCLQTVVEFSNVPNLFEYTCSQSWWVICSPKCLNSSGSAGIREHLRVYFEDISREETERKYGKSETNDKTWQKLIWSSELLAEADSILDGNAERSWIWRQLLTSDI